MGCQKLQRGKISTSLWLLPWCMFQSGMICLLNIPIWNSLLFSFMGCQNREEDIVIFLGMFCIAKGSKRAHLLAEILFQFSSELFCVAKAPSMQRTLVTTTTVCMILSVPNCLLSAEKTLSSLNCGGFFMVEEFGREAATVATKF